MANLDLWAPHWQALPEARQRFLMQQLSRYFLSPLLAIDAQQPVSVEYFGQTLRTFDILVAGEWLRFVPGHFGVTLGAKNPLPAPWRATLGPANLSPVEAVDMPPMLVARAAVPSSLQVIGRVNLTTQRFTGDHFAYVPHKPAVQGLLTRPSDPLNPTDWPATLTAGAVVLRLQSAHHYQVAITTTEPPAALARRLSRFGYSLPTERQYEYLMSGGLAQATPWGNRWPTRWPHYVPNRFGLTVPLARRGPEYVLGDWAKSLALRATPATPAALSPWFRAPAAANPAVSYRKLVVITLAPD